jgi:predicted O-methyltransferase YrrM
MVMTDERWRFLLSYPHEVFGGNDQQLDSLIDRATQAGLPPIAITHGAGQLLRLLTSTTPGRVALELGTLGGFSGIWIARGLPANGRLITIEFSDLHADFAQKEFETAGLSDRVQIIRGAALEVIPSLATELGPGSVDFVFIDAVKSEYIDYFDVVKPMIGSGGLLVADNVYGTGHGWIDEGFGTNDFNHHVAADDEFEATTIPVGGGLLVARKR